MCSLTDGQYSQGVFSDEGGKLLGGHAFSEDASMHTAGFLNDAWQGTPLDRVRAADREFTVLYGRRLSMHLMVQPKISKKFLGNDLHRDQGLLARWLIAAPQSIAGTRLEISRTSPADIPEVCAYWAALSRLLELPVLEDHEVGGLSLPLLRLMPEAFELLKAACLEWELAQGPGHPLEAVKEWASKAAEQACRIAGVLTLVDDPDQPFVHAETMRRAIQLAQFYLSEYQRVIGASAPPPHLDRAQVVLQWLQRTQRAEVTAREIMREGPKAVRTSEAARAALRALERDGWLTSRDNKVYRVHLYVHTVESLS
jgi:hypothetical protein